jgi:hypothetical protein
LAHDVAFDALGQTIKEGDVIFYGIRNGNSVASHPSVVLEVEPYDMAKRVKVAMWSLTFEYFPATGKYGWKKTLKKSYFYTLTNAVKVHPDYYTDEIRELLSATGMGGQERTNRGD